MRASIVTMNVPFFFYLQLLSEQIDSVHLNLSSASSSLAPTNLMSLSCTYHYMHKSIFVLAFWLGVSALALFDWYFYVAHMSKPSKSGFYSFMYCSSDVLFTDPTIWQFPFCDLQLWIMSFPPFSKPHSIFNFLHSSHVYYFSSEVGTARWRTRPILLPALCTWDNGTS